MRVLKEKLSREDKSPVPQPVILLIEDDQEDIELFRLALAQTGSPFKLIAVQFAKDAIRYLCRFGHFTDEEQYPKPSLIVLDLSLPGMSGLDFLMWAKGEAPEKIPPIVVLSYSALELDRRLAEKLGAKAFFVKSPDLEQTIALTKNLLLASSPPPLPSESGEDHQKPI